MSDSGLQGAVADDGLLSAGFAERGPAGMLFREHLQPARTTEVGDGGVVFARGGAGTSFTDRAGARAGECSGVSQARRLFGVRGRLGAVLREPWRRAGALQRSLLEIWAAGV